MREWDGWDEPTDTHVDLDETKFFQGEAFLLVEAVDHVDLIGVKELLAAATQNGTWVCKRKGKTKIQKKNLAKPRDSIGEEEGSIY